MDQPAFPAGRKIDLGNIPGNHHMGTEPEPGQDHFHLLGSCILRFIENNKRTVQRTAPHISQRRYFNRAALQVLLCRIAAQHIKQGVI